MDLTIGVDIGGTNILAGVVTPPDEIVARTPAAHDPTIPTRSRPRSPTPYAELIEPLPGRQHRRSGRWASSAPTDATLLFAPNIAWRNHPLADAAGSQDRAPGGDRERRQRRRLGRVPFRQRPRHARTWSCSPWARDLGGAVITGGQLIRGAFGAAAELGHIKVVPDGAPCGCGQHGCWEAYASGTALAKHAQRFAYDYIAGRKDPCWTSPPRTARRRPRHRRCSPGRPSCARPAAPARLVPRHRHRHARRRPRPRSRRGRRRHHQRRRRPDPPRRPGPLPPQPVRTRPPRRAHHHHRSPGQRRRHHRRRRPGPRPRWHPHAPRLRQRTGPESERHPPRKWAR